MDQKQVYKTHYLIALILIGVAYYVFGRLGLLLAIPPGYATAVWPASGIALAGTLLLGYRVWPGIVWGSFCVNVGTSFDASSTQAIITSLTLAFSIGSGAALQAVLGTYLIRRVVGFPNTLEYERDIFKFLTIGGPVACLASASVGVTSLWAFGVIPTANVLYSWWTWWVGDTIGVLIFTPIVLIMLAKPRAAWQHRRLSVALPLCISFAVAVAIFVLASRWEVRRFKLEFEQECLTVVHNLENRLGIYWGVLHSLKGFYASLNHVDRPEFEIFAKNLLAPHKGIQALSWNPYILHDQRTQYEREAQQDGFVNYELKERNDQGDIVPAPQRESYIAVHYIAPYVGNENALGFNVASNPVRAEALHWACDEDKLVATGRIRLLQETGDQYGFLAFVPIYHKGIPLETVDDRRKNLQGYVTGVFRVGDLLTASLAEDALRHIDFQIYDQTAPTEEQLLFNSQTETSPARTPSALPFEWETTLEVGGRQWKLHFSPTLAYLGEQQTWHLWLVLASGLLFTSLSGAFLLVLTGRTVRVERVVEERTIELSRMNMHLEQEVLERKSVQDALVLAVEEAEAANRAKSEFLANVSHEIRTPMNGIMGMTDLTLGTELTEEQKENLNMVKFSAASLLRIINEVLDFSRIETGNLHLEVAPFPLQTTLYRVITELDFLADQKSDVVLTCHIDDTVPVDVMGDVSRLRQILINLVGNALKFTEVGEVTLRSKVVSQDERDVVVQFTIQDTGIGIPKDKQTKIFEAFVQADGSTTRKYGGTGLGLAIASQIVARMDGKIWVESEVGVGSQFHFTARFGKADVATAASTDREIANEKNKKDVPQQLHILVVEDNLVNQRLALKLLQNQGHDVVVSGNGRDALDVWAQGNFDLILMDMQMPEMDGFEATQKIRQQEQTRGGHIPIVAMTAHAMVGDREKCLAAGMDDYISKPIHVETLTQVIRDLFRASNGSSSE